MCVERMLAVVDVSSYTDQGKITLTGICMYVTHDRFFLCKTILMFLIDDYIYIQPNILNKSDNYGSKKK